MPKSFLFDLNKCTGCQACQIACSIENQVDTTMSWRQVHTFNPQHLPNVPLFHLTMACNHCADPPCMNHCPALAYSKDANSGAVTIDPELCIGCKYCTWACPYDAPQFNPRTGVIEKCTFCNHRLERGLEPACVALCPTGALAIGELEDADDNGKIPGFTETEIGPAIRLIPLREDHQIPAMSLFDAEGEIEDPPDELICLPDSKIDLRSEWTLVAFTFLASLAVGFFAARAATSESFDAWLLAIAGLCGMGLSSLHLGNKKRAYRAILNWRRSWLSREVILYPAFLVLAVVFLFSGSSSEILHVLTIFIGFAALFAMDRVYDVTRTKRLPMHSAQVVLTGLYCWGLFSGNLWLFGVIWLLKVVLFSLRKTDIKDDLIKIRPFISSLRISLGFPFLLILWSAEQTGIFEYFAVLFALIGEFIDRCEYYLELEIPTPQRQMAIDLRADYLQISRGIE